MMKMILMYYWCPGPSIIFNRTNGGSGDGHENTNTNGNISNNSYERVYNNRSRNPSPVRLITKMTTSEIIIVIFFALALFSIILIYK